MALANLAVVTGLQAAITLVENHPTIPAPYISVADTSAHALWLLHNTPGASPLEQQATALRIFDELGGTWSQQDYTDDDRGPMTRWQRREGQLLLHVQAQRQTTLTAVPS